MPAALIAITSMCSGHGCFPARNATTGSPDININNKPAHRKDDKWQFILVPVPMMVPYHLAALKWIGMVNKLEELVIPLVVVAQRLQVLKILL